MSKAAKIIAVVAGAVAVVATAGVALGALAGGTMMLTGVASAATIASIAGAVSGVASMVAAKLQKKPALKGSVSQVVIGATMPVPYAMGRTYTGGMQVYDNSAGDKNEWRYQVMVFSGGGPIEEFEGFYADYTHIPLSVGAEGGATGWYSGFLEVQNRGGTRPENAHTATATAMPSWGTSHKMSGYASYRVAMKFDKDGKRFASGIPQVGYVAKGVRVYDPRLDSTYPGGSGAHRWDDEATWTWSENPALHALTYARGRFVTNGVAYFDPSYFDPAYFGTSTESVKILGAGLPKDSIDIPSFVELANLCEANDWKVGGLIYEAPDLSKWDNLKRILQAGGAQPVWAGGLLRLRISAPRPSLFAISADDLADGSIEVQAMRGFRDRRNSIVPKYRAEDHKWEYVQGDAVTADTYVAEDGELKPEEIQFDLVQDKDQAAQLAAYEMVNAREFGPINMTVKPRLLAYKLGEAGTIDIPEAGLVNQLAVITGRTVNPANGTITLTLESETAAKHAYALGLTGTAPPTPVIRSSEELDIGAGDVGISGEAMLVLNSWTEGLTATVDASGNVLVSDHVRVYADKRVNVTGYNVLASGDPGEFIAIYYDDPDRAGGAVTYNSKVPPENAGDAFASEANPHRHFIASMTVPTSGTNDGSTGGPPGWKQEWGTGILP